MILRIYEILFSDVLCKIDCNYMNCKFFIGVKRDLKFVRYILLGNSIFESCRFSFFDDGIYVCIVNNRKLENNFKLIILCKYKLLILFKK